MGWEETQKEAREAGEKMVEGALRAREDQAVPNDRVIALERENEGLRLELLDARRKLLLCKVELESVWIELEVHRLPLAASWKEVMDGISKLYKHADEHEHLYWEEEAEEEGEG